MTQRQGGGEGCECVACEASRRLGGPTVRDKVRSDYVAGVLPLVRLAVAHGVSRSVVLRWSRDEAWTTLRRVHRHATRHRIRGFRAVSAAVAELRRSLQLSERKALRLLLDIAAELELRESGGRYMVRA